MINKVLKALKEKDYVGLAQCFSKDCKYSDYCPSLNGKQNYLFTAVRVLRCFSETALYSTILR